MRPALPCPNSIPPVPIPVYHCSGIGTSSIRLHTDNPQGLSDAAPPLAAHHPIRRNCIPAARLVKRVHTPDMAVALAETGEANESEFRDYCNNISEWLSLVSLGSARVLADDRIDSYLSRYEVPRTREELEVVDLVVVKWMGFIPANWITQLLVSCL